MRRAGLGDEVDLTVGMWLEFRPIVPDGVESAWGAGGSQPANQ